MLVLVLGLRLKLGLGVPARSLVLPMPLSAGALAVMGSDGLLWAVLGSWGAPWLGRGCG